MDSTYKQIADELSELKDKLEKNRQLFNLTADDAETEALILEERALSIRYSELIKRVKQTIKKG